MLVALLMGCDNKASPPLGPWTCTLLDGSQFQTAFTPNMTSSWVVLVDDEHQANVAVPAARVRDCRRAQ